MVDSSIGVDKAFVEALLMHFLGMDNPSSQYKATDLHTDSLVQRAAFHYCMQTDIET